MDSDGMQPNGFGYQTGFPIGGGSTSGAGSAYGPVSQGITIGTSLFNAIGAFNLSMKPTIDLNGDLTKVQGNVNHVNTGQNAPEDHYNIYSDGTITVQRDDKTTNTYTYYESNGTTIDLGTYDKNPQTNLTNLNPESLNSPFFLNGDVAAGVLGAARDYKDETGETAQFTQMTNFKGEHSGHGGDLGGYADARYANKNGDVDETVTTNSSNFDQGNSQKLVNSFKKFGFNGPTSILTENPAGNGPALKGTHFVNGRGKFTHKNHMHLQHFDKKRIKQL